ncbi:MAG: hypothetical protein IPM51_04245 [Sphingobacteriaceae bacterium]|nr:hypothetical protein [Sphingobacteriaceae bacterium]
MKKAFITWCVAILSFGIQAQTVKSKNLQLKYTPPAGWNAKEFGGATPWEDAGNEMCKCGGVYFFRTHGDGKMNVVVYASTQSGLDSTKRNFVGSLHFEDVQKWDRTKNKAFSFERKKSNFTDSKTKAKSYDVIRYQTKVDNHFYIIYTWQENMQALNSTNEKLLYEMVNAIEPIK